MSPPLFSTSNLYHIISNWQIAMQRLIVKNNQVSLNSHEKEINPVSTWPCLSSSYLKNYWLSIKFKTHQGY